MHRKREPRLRPKRVVAKWCILRGFMKYMRMRGRGMPGMRRETRMNQGCCWARVAYFSWTAVEEEEA